MSAQPSVFMAVLDLVIAVTRMVVIVCIVSIALGASWRVMWATRVTFSWTLDGVKHSFCVGECPTEPQLTVDKDGQVRLK